MPLLSNNHDHRPHDDCPQSVALISGGKDSLLSLTHAIAHGHRIVALANLHPPTPRGAASSVVTPASAVSLVSGANDELDSYMYQTIGHTLLPLYSRCLGLPLYRRAIVGTARSTDLEYSAKHPDDETEDLFALLSDVKADFPRLQAVTSGAIASSYQRTRVESCCSRLGLRSAAYLWQMPQWEVLGAVRECGWDARIVKVAALGLGVEWLWAGVGEEETQRRLKGLERKWGINVAGEGGEFETLVMSAPGWGGRIEVREEERLVEEAGGGAWWIAFKGGRVVECEGTEQEGWAKGIKAPLLLEDEFSELLEGIEDPAIPPSAPKPAISPPPIPKSSIFTTPAGNWHIHNLTSPTTSEDIESEAHAVLTSLFTHLPEPHTLTSISLAITDITDFPAVNKVYTTFFPAPLPPARVTISLPALPTRIVLSATAVPSAITRLGLHVQSRSYWAPSNIARYSQCIAHGSWLEVAGQIPLVPSTMTPLQSGIGQQTALACQHLMRIVKAVDSGATVEGVVAYVCGVGEEGVGIVGEVLRRWCEGVRVVVGVNGLPMNVQVEVVGLVKRTDAQGGVWIGRRAEEGVRTAFVDVEREGWEADAARAAEDRMKAVPGRGVWDGDGKRRDMLVVGRSCA